MRFRLGSSMPYSLQEDLGFLGGELGDIHFQLALQRHQRAVLVGVGELPAQPVLRPG